MTKWYKYSLKEYGIPSSPIKKNHSLKGRGKGNNIDDQRQTQHPILSLSFDFSPDFGIFTHFCKYRCSHALAYHRALGKKNKFSSFAFTSAKMLGVLDKSLPKFAH